MSLYIFLYIYIYIVGILSLCLRRKHIFLCLLSLEFIILSLFILLYLYLARFNYESYFGIIFLAFRVCEGVVGLSIMVSLIRSHGNDYLSSFRLILC